MQLNGGLDSISSYTLHDFAGGAATIPVNGRWSSHGRILSGKYVLSCPFVVAAHAQEDGRGPLYCSRASLLLEGLSIAKGCDPKP